MSTMQVQPDVEEVIADLSSRVGELTAAVAMRDSALRKAHRRIADLEDSIAHNSVADDAAAKKPAPQKRGGPTRVQSQD